jgi:hypothetical protein
MGFLVGTLIEVLDSNAPQCRSSDDTKLRGLAGLEVNVRCLYV